MVSKDITYELLYTAGNYTDCLEELKELLVHIRNGCDVSKLVAMSRLDKSAVEYEPHVLTLILEGNIDVIRTAILLDSDEPDLTFAQYAKFKALSLINPTIPYSIHLNSLYNSLWCLWMKWSSDDQTKNKVLDMLEDCFIRVLSVNNIQAQTVLSDIKSDKVLTLMCQVINNVNRLEAIQSIPIIEICLLCLLLFLEWKVPVGDKLHSFIVILRDSWPQVRVKCVQIMTDNNIKKINSNFLRLFKLGFFEVNEITEYDVDKLHETFSIIVCLVLHRMEYDLNSSEVLTDHLSGGCSKFVCTYIQAYIALQLKQLDVAQIYLDKASYSSKNDYEQELLFLLQGQHALSSSQLTRACAYFTKLLPSVEFVWTGLFHILKTVVISLHSLYDRDTNISSQMFTEKFIHILRCFHTFVNHFPYCEDSNIHDPKRKLLYVLHAEKKYGKEDILHLIGKEILWIQMLHLSTEDGFDSTAIAYECYLDVLSIYFKNDPYLRNLSLSSGVLHEAVVALILHGQIDSAEIVCDILISKCDLLKERKIEEILCDTESFCMEGNTAALILKSIIQIHQKNYKDAQNVLMRVKKMLVHKYFTFSSLCKEDLGLLDALTAKVYIMKAQVSFKLGCKMDAFQYCQKALIHNAGDDIVKGSIKIAQGIGREINVPQNGKCYAVRLCKSVTLQYLLISNE